jgi:hypothetical protein
MVPYRLCASLSFLRLLRRLIIHEGTRFMVRLLWRDSQGDSDRPSVGGKDLEEIELLHLDGHKGSKPVRFVSPINYSTAINWLIPKVSAMVQLTMCSWYVLLVIAVSFWKLIWPTGHLWRIVSPTYAPWLASTDYGQGWIVFTSDRRCAPWPIQNESI